MDTKIIAMYLPQFHCIPENDEFWGKDFTDWVSVKKATPVYKGQVQPRIPLNDNYYDLSEKENVAWQAKLAKEYGVDGFGIYHYWFNNEKNILTKPAEIIRDNKDIDITYFFAWDNGNWKRSWSNVQGNDWSPLEENTEKRGPEVLIPYILGKEKDWENHFNYLLSHFKDERYIKIDNKPVFIIYNYNEDLIPMCKYWNELAIANGFAGVEIIYRYEKAYNIPKEFNQYYYQPLTAAWRNRISVRKIFYKLMTKMNIKFIEKYDYDNVWKYIIRKAKKNKEKNIYHGGFVMYDDTPRRGEKGKIITGASPLKFKKYLKQLADICQEQNKRFLFLTAWNEWGEGAYLEPDTTYGYSYLEAIRSIVIEEK